MHRESLNGSFSSLPWDSRRFYATLKNRSLNFVVLFGAFLVGVAVFLSSTRIEESSCQAAAKEVVLVLGVSNKVSNISLYSMILHSLDQKNFNVRFKRMNDSYLGSVVYLDTLAGSLRSRGYTLQERTSNANEGFVYAVMYLDGRLCHPRSIHSISFNENHDEDVVSFSVESTLVNESRVFVKKGILRTRNRVDTYEKLMGVVPTFRELPGIGGLIVQGDALHIRSSTESRVYAKSGPLPVVLKVAHVCMSRDLGQCLWRVSLSSANKMAEALLVSTFALLRDGFRRRGVLAEIEPSVVLM
jgi:hypothetical protein